MEKRKTQDYKNTTCTLYKVCCIGKLWERKFTHDNYIHKYIQHNNNTVHIGC